MSNRVCFQNCKFVNVDSEGKETGEVTYGYRAYDSYGACYDNLFGPDELIQTPEAALETLRNGNEVAKALYQEAQSQGGLEFNGEWFGV
jgi:hypothetical protein